MGHGSRPGTTGKLHPGQVITASGGSLKAGSTAGTLPPIALFDNYWAPTMAFAHSLGRRGVPVHVYGPGASRWSRYCTRRYACPAVEDADRFLPWLQERVRSGE